jgi:hypothetical protein
MAFKRKGKSKLGHGKTAIASPFSHAEMKTLRGGKSKGKRR